MAHIYRRHHQTNKKKLTPDDDGDGEEEIKCVFTYLFRTICFEFRAVPVPYFLDEMPEWELSNIIDNLPYCDRNYWEGVRLQSFLIAKGRFKGVKTTKDIVTFPWDKEDSSNSTSSAATEISNEDIQRLKKIARQWDK